MKKSKLFYQLNRSTSLKAIVIAVIIVAIEVIFGFVVYDSYADHTYREAYAEYEKQMASIGEDVEARLGTDVENIYTDASVRDELVNMIAEYDEFTYYAVIRQAGNGQVIWNNLPDSTARISDYKSTHTLENAQKVYVFTSYQLSDSQFYIAGLADFTARQEIIDGMLANLVGLLIGSGLLILAAFLFYVFWAGAKQRVGRFDYRFTVDSKGKVAKSNAKLIKDFGNLKEIKTDFSSYDKKSYNFLKLRSLNGEKLLISRVLPLNNGKYKVYASNIKNADSVDFADETDELTSTGKAKASLSKAFEDFVKRGKRTLIGVMYISNLNQISALFGKEMALNIQKIVMQKAQEKFLYVYELDLAMIGMAYPDGKNLDILLSEMDDNLNYISQPIKMEDNLFTVELKSGFALCDATMESLTFEYAMKAVEAARSRVIETKVADYIVYHESQKKLYTKYFITYNIKQMLAEGAFEMEYQPQYNIKEKRIEGFEALFRVKKSWNVNVDTFSFITYAERTGAMVQLGDFIFDTGMQFAKRLEGKNVSVSLNVSPVQLMQAGFIENFLRLYKKYDLQPGSICVEITESFLMTNFNETLKKLEILKSNGILTHLDDFGTEYSSLLYIKKLPIAAIKIDKEFVRDVVKSKESQAIIKFITNIAKLVDCTTICEGVEMPNEFDILQVLGCDTIQGWLIGKSMKPDDALKIVDTFDYDAAAKAKLAQSAGKK